MVGYWGLFRLPRVYELYQLVRCLVSPKMFFLKNLNVQIACTFQIVHCLHTKQFSQDEYFESQCPLVSSGQGFSYLTSGGITTCQNLLIGHWWLIANLSLRLKVDSVSLWQFLGHLLKHKELSDWPAISRNWNLGVSHFYLIFINCRCGCLEACVTSVYTMVLPCQYHLKGALLCGFAVKSVSHQRVYQCQMEWQQSPAELRIHIPFWQKYMFRSSNMVSVGRHDSATASE